VKERDKKQPKEEIIEWKCWRCSWTFNAPIYSGFRTSCPQCGAIVIASGFDVETSESQRILKELDEGRKREMKNRMQSEGW
jgi:DNA-directed RNA polymerase subunit RPC12/RpoP